MKRALIIGLGKSGMAAASYLKSLGWHVTGTDKTDAKRGELENFFLEDLQVQEFPYDLVVVSPGVNPNHPYYQRAIKEKVELIGEAELGLREIKNPVIGITGTNGKSTLTMMIAHILNFSGRKAVPLGNIGTPFVSYLSRQNPEEIIVAEISSFQLETMKTQSLDIAIFYNFSEDHRDRYRDIHHYFETKQKIGEFLKPSGKLYLEKEVAKLYGEFKGSALLDNSECPMKEFLPLQVQPFVEIAIATFAIVRHFGVSKEVFFAGMQSFVPLRHRIQFIKEVRGIRCYNDSKATNVDAVLFAARAIGKNIILIAGGVNDGSDFSLFCKVLPPFVKKIILIGEAKETIAKQVANTLPVIFAKDLKEAVEKGLQLGKVGDNLLLSPGCKSFDMFQNYEKRGEAFIGALG